MASYYMRSAGGGSGDGRPPGAGVCVCACMPERTSIVAASVYMPVSKPSGGGGDQRPTPVAESVYMIVDGRLESPGVASTYVGRSSYTAGGRVMSVFGGDMTTAIPAPNGFGMQTVMPASTPTCGGADMVSRYVPSPGYVPKSVSQAPIAGACSPVHPLHAHVQVRRVSAVARSQHTSAVTGARRTQPFGLIPTNSAVMPSM
jgi:hypothetical protein